MFETRAILKCPGQGLPRPQVRLNRSCEEELWAWGKPEGAWPRGKGPK